MRRWTLLAALALSFGVLVGVAAASAPGADVRLTHDANDPDNHPIPVGPIWLGYYRSENSGSSFVSSLVPGYPDDTSPYGRIAKQQVRTASAGDPVIAWDAQGRAFFGSESSDDPAGTPKTFGDVWVATFDNPGGSTGDPQN